MLLIWHQQNIASSYSNVTFLQASFLSGWSVILVKKVHYPSDVLGLQVVNLINSLWITWNDIYYYRYISFGMIYNTPLGQNEGFLYLCTYDFCRFKLQLGEIFSGSIVFSGEFLLHWRRGFSYLSMCNLSLQSS